MNEEHGERLEDRLDRVFRYHDQTKHQLDRSARSLGYLDWATQPDPFRRFDGAPQILLDHPPLSNQPTYDALFAEDGVPACPVDRASISRLFYDSLALSAWKQAPGTGRWSLRINPSSGALHPTEGYLIAGLIDGLTSSPAVCHYAPYRHVLEQRVTLTGDEWSALAAELPPAAVLVALTSIYWRESWKYGERAFRYCQHDVGHAIGAVVIAAATLGWRTSLIQTVGDDALAALLGNNRQHGIEAEHPDCLLAVYPGARSADPCRPAVHLAAELVARLATVEFSGQPNVLSHEHQAWPVIDEVARAARFLAETDSTESPSVVRLPFALPDRELPAQQIIRQRRSAIEMDGRTRISREVFYHMLSRLMPRGGFPWDVLPWEPAVSLAIFVHRVDDLPPGLYLLVRDARHERSLRDSLKGDFQWQRPENCPAGLDLWCLVQADCRRAARIISCRQAIAAEGAFSLGMLAHFEHALRHRGAWFYPRLFWETGLIGQMLYLEAEAAGVRATGIGCFFDDMMHELLGIAGRRWQSLYHFTVGGPLEDLRLRTIPPYEHLQGG